MSLVQVLEDLEKLVRKEIDNQFPPAKDWFRAGWIRMSNENKIFLDLKKKDLTDVNSPEEYHTYELVNHVTAEQEIKTEIANFF